MMAMNKAEKARLEELETELALRWPTAAEPVPMTREEIEAAEVKLIPRDRSVHREGDAALGWFQNAYTGLVTQGWSNGMYHNRDNTTGDGGSHGMGCMYRDKADAALAMRWEMSRQFAGKLRRVDVMIAEARRA